MDRIRAYRGGGGGVPIVGTLQRTSCETPKVEVADYTFRLVEAWESYEPLSKVL